MVVSKSGFFAALGSLAAGGVGGYVAHDHLRLDPYAGQPHVTEEPTPAPVPSTAPTPVDTKTPAVPPAPACDDGTGQPAACPPPVYSADEGLACAPVATKRCEDFKASMKPHVAEQAVACLLALKPAERCDAARVNLCGHEALMSACAPPPPASPDAGAGAATAMTGAAGGTSERDEVHATCDAIVRSCTRASRGECESTVSGMTAVGRQRMTQCMAAHCADKGLLGCEAVDDGKAPGATSMK